MDNVPVPRELLEEAIRAIEDAIYPGYEPVADRLRALLAAPVANHLNKVVDGKQE